MQVIRKKWILIAVAMCCCYAGDSLYAQIATQLNNEKGDGDTVNEPPPMIQTANGKIRFAAHKGKVANTLPNKEWKDQQRIRVSPDAKSLIKEEEKIENIKSDSEGKSEQEITATIAYYNVFGERVWAKKYVVDSSLDIADEGEPEPYFVKISDTGRVIAFVRTHSLPDTNWYADMVVLDKYGTQISSVAYIPALEEGSPSDFEISPDGLLISASVPKPGKDGAEQYVFFLNVETGKTKIVKAEGGEVGDKGRVPYELLADKKIIIPGRRLEKGKWQNSIFSFEQIPDDLSVLPGDK